MATEVLELVIRVQGGQQASQQLDGVKKSAEGLTGALRFMRNALVAISFLRAAEGAVALVEQFQLAQNQIALVTNNIQEASVAQKVLAQLAIETRAPYEATVLTFGQLARTTTSMNLNFGQLLSLTRMWNESIAISGVNAQNAKNAFRDFVELMAVGVAQGRQLRAMVMQNPVFAQSIASGLTELAKNKSNLGPLAADLQKLIDKGKELSGAQVFAFATLHKGALGAKLIVDAILTQQLTMQTTFEKTNETIGQAFTNLYTKTLLFVGGVAQATGWGRDLNVAIEKIGDNIGLFLGLAAAVAALLVFNLVTGAVIGFGGAAVRVTTLLLGGFGNVMIALRGIAAFFLANPIVIGLALLATMIGFVFRDQINAGAANVFDRIKQMGGWVEFIIRMFAVLGGYIITVFTDPLTVVKTLGEAIIDMANLGIGALEALFNASIRGMNNVSDFVKAHSGIDLGHANEQNFGRIPNPLAGSASKLDTDTKGNIQAVYAALQNVKGLLTGGLGVDSDTLAGFLGGHPPGAGKTGDLDEHTKGMERAKAALLDYLRQVSPYAAAQAKIADLDAKVANAIEKGVDVGEIWKKLGFDQTEANRRLAREVIGVGNAVTDYTERLRLLNEHKNDLTPDEAAEEALANHIKLLQSIHTIGSGVAQALDEMNQSLSRQDTISKSAVTQALELSKGYADLKIQTDALTLAQREGTITDERATFVKRALNIAAKERDTGSAQAGIDVAQLKTDQMLANRNKIAQDAVTAADASTTAFELLSVQTEILNSAFEKGQISAEGYNKTLRDYQITALSTKTDTFSGFQKGLLDVQKSLSDTSQAAANVVTGAFNDMTDALTNFFTTGKLNFASFINDLAAGLAKLAIQQEIMGPLANALGLGAPGGGVGGSPAGGLLGSATGGVGSLLGGLGTVANGNVGTGLLGGIQDFLAGFANEGQFQVGGQGGTDSQLVAFRASPDETVSITKPGHRNGGGDTHYNITVPVYGATDADSFKQSEGQVSAAIGAAARRALSRNGKN